MFTFLSPLLIWGTLLGVIPIIIHLLNRRRFRRVEWAPMRYLKLTIRRNRRRIQIEQLLLLLLRIALPVLLFLLLARPLLNPTGLESWLGGGGRVSQVILVDDSLSMGYAVGRSARVPPRPRGRRRPARRPPGRRTAARSSPPRPRARPVFHEVEGTRREELSGDALALPQTETHAAWPTVLDGGRRGRPVVHLPDAAADDHHRPAQGRLGRRRSSPSPAAGTSRGSASGSSTSARDETANVALESLVPLDRTILAGAESRWEAVIRNPLVYLAELSFAVAFGVLLDTFLVRTLLVPALTLDVGRAIWWPNALARTAKK